MTAFLTLLSAYLCRMTGSDYSVLPSFQWRGKAIGNGEWKILWGWLIAALYGHPFDYMTPGIIALFFIGETWGWGEPVGAALTGRKMNPANLEKWQFGPLKKDPWMALAFRGLMWGAPVALLSYWEHSLVSLPFIFMLAMPLGVLAAKNIKVTVNEKWTYQEVVRGLIVGLLIAGVMYANTY